MKLSRVVRTGGAKISAVVAILSIRVGRTVVCLRDFILAPTAVAHVVTSAVALVTVIRMG